MMASMKTVTVTISIRVMRIMIVMRATVIAVMAAS